MSDFCGVRSKLLIGQISIIAQLIVLFTGGLLSSAPT